MAGEGRPVGSRPVWPDVVIAAAFVVLVAVGIFAVFGPTLRSWFGEPAPGPGAGAAVVEPRSTL